MDGPCSIILTGGGLLMTLLNISGYGSYSDAIVCTSMWLNLDLLVVEAVSLKLL
jgi:hypothetical protein